MIIEVFGPPAAGKTTFVAALATALRERGHVVETMISSRPAEAEEAPHAGDATGLVMPAVLTRVIRPFAEVLKLARHPSASSPGQTAELMRLMPPKSPIWFVRVAQYLLRLNTTWQRAAHKVYIVLFDQAYVQAVCSLILLGRPADDALVMRLLDKIPHPDLLIQLEAPKSVLETRLRDRCRDQSVMERFFEFDLTTNLDSIRVIEDLDRLVARRGWPMIRACSLDQQLLAQSIAMIEAICVHSTNRPALQTKSVSNPVIPTLA